MSPYIFSGLNPSAAYMFLNDKREEHVKAPDEIIEQTIIENVCKYFGVSITDIKGKCRKREFSEPRMICMYLIARHTELTLKEIGRTFSNRDHSTVINARETVSDLVHYDRTLKKKILEIEASISQVLAAA